MKLIFFLSVFSIAFNSSLQEAYDNASQMKTTTNM